jgi:hypothetical protein
MNKVLVDKELNEKAKLRHGENETFIEMMKKLEIQKE